MEFDNVEVFAEVGKPWRRRYDSLEVKIREGGRFRRFGLFALQRFGCYSSRIPVVHESYSSSESKERGYRRRSISLPFDIICWYVLSPKDSTVSSGNGKLPCVGSFCIALQHLQAVACAVKLSLCEKGRESEHRKIAQELIMAPLFPSGSDWPASESYKLGDLMPGEPKWLEESEEPAKYYGASRRALKDSGFADYVRSRGQA
jgi:hypothetical protein